MLFLWIILYGLLFYLAELPLPQWVSPVCMVAFSAALVLWCCGGQRRRQLGLTTPVPVGKGWGWYALVLLALPPWQMCVIRSVAVDALLPLFTAVLAEELFFRGFLLERLCRRSCLLGVVGSAALFAALHSVNFLAGCDSAYVTVQILTALVAGVYWGLIRLRFQSLLPCVIAHLLVNLTGAAPTAAALPRLLPGLCVCCVLMAGSSVLLYKRISDGGAS